MSHVISVQMVLALILYQYNSHPSSISFPTIWPSSPVNHSKLSLQFPGPAFPYGSGWLVDWYCPEKIHRHWLALQSQSSICVTAALLGLSIECSQMERNSVQTLPIQAFDFLIWFYFLSLVIMAPPTAIDMIPISDPPNLSSSGRPSVNDILARRSRAPVMSGGVAAYASSDMFRDPACIHYDILERVRER